ncbi:hypothetical protein L596_028371 [Steinernema carpocapsae]|uniref:NADH:ubiquinone oxidoreductase intermediate-associated protein 30 domain-containing protein n=1 Tax=Steinernema carpocapsae TaxID=34508 RepID=A0A4U5LY83_STECR|nr:hypothetical protein L596_028371 [Steinernema carpocapsae]
MSARIGFKLLSRPISGRRLFSSSTPSTKSSVAERKERSGWGISTTTKGSLEKKKGWSIIKRSDVPISINFPNEKGVEGYDPDVPMKEIIADAPRILKRQLAMVKDEVKNSISLEKKQMVENAGAVKHNEARVEYRFDSDEAMKLWHTGCDKDWNEGYSQMELLRTDKNTAIFKGAITGALIKDGKVERAGWAAMKTEDRKSLNRKKHMDRWASFSHFLIKCRGDGRSYKLMLYTPGGIDVTWGDSYAYPLHTHGGPYWQYEKIPFSRFLHTVGGRIQDAQCRVNPYKISSVGIVIMDRIEGDFQLEIDFIGVCNDRSHQEDFAYETYTLPIFNPMGI